MRLLITLTTIFLLSYCKPTVDIELRPTDWNIVGSWYTDVKDGGGLYDSIMNYAEIYVNDTILYYQEERMGQSSNQKYFIKNDSIYKCFGTGKECEYTAIWKIDGLKNDTLWLTVNNKYTKRDPKTYWVKFPKDEKGHFEYSWTKDNSDSLNWAIVFDYDRRKYKYYATLGNNEHLYDSALKAGKWKWDMKEKTIQEWIERRRKRGE